MVDTKTTQEIIDTYSNFRNLPIKSPNRKWVSLDELQKAIEDFLDYENSLSDAINHHQIKKWWNERFFAQEEKENENKR